MHIRMHAQLHTRMRRGRSVWPRTEWHKDNRHDDDDCDDVDAYNRIGDGEEGEENQAESQTKKRKKKGAAPKLSAFRGPMSFSPVPLIHHILNLLLHIHNNYIYCTPPRRCCVVSHFYVMILLYIPFHYYCCCCRRCSVGVVLIPTRSLARWLALV